MDDAGLRRSIMGPSIGRRALLAGAGSVLAAMHLPGAAWAQASLKQGRPEARALYRDASQPVSARVEDLLRRMTLEEKVGQMMGVWETRGDIQTPAGAFSPDRASKAYPNGLGQISRPGDWRGVDPKANAAVAGAATRPQGRLRSM